MTTKEIKPRCLKAGNAAAYMNISRRYLSEISQQGRIPYHKIGTRCLVYDIADLDRFLDECKIGGEVSK